MEDRSSKKETTTVFTAGYWQSCCRRCGRKKRKLDNCSDHQQGYNCAEGMMLKSNVKNHICNPLGYIVSRQINDRINYCKKLVDTRFSSAQNLFRKDLYSHYGCINAIEFSKEGDLLISGGDDKRVLLWNVEKSIQEHGKPIIMKAQHMSNIFCLGYNNSKTKIFSAGNDDQVIVHDLQTTDVLNFFHHEKPVYGLSVHPYNDNVFSSACDDGRVLIYDIRGSANSAESFFCLAQYKNSFHSVMFNPVEPVMLVTANAKEGVSMWDVRKPLIPVLKYGSEGPAQSCMNVRFNQTGTTLLALRRRLPPVLYAVNSAIHLCQFDHPGYYNSCTMKSCCFAGNNDEYILSGSDDFNLYMWRIPIDEGIKWVDSAHIILRGHRSIVNQVRYNQTSYILASSGVEKIIKLWSPFSFSHKCLGGLKRDDDKEEKQRRVYTHDEYIGLVLRSGQFMTHDYSHQSIDEDQRMMAFFDSLVQREIESWSSEDVPTLQSPSDAENNATDRNNISDSGDSIASENQLMRRFITSTFNSLASSSVSERPLESPNRITRLIANRREKLMRLAAFEASSQYKNCVSTVSSSMATSTITTMTTIAITMSIPTSSVTMAAPILSRITESNLETEPENNILSRNNKSKLSRIILKSKSISRNSSHKTAIRNRIRRKLCSTKEKNSDTDSDNYLRHHKNTYLIDVTQPSTSSGVISDCCSQFAPTSPISGLRRRRLHPSSSSSDDSEIKVISNYANRRRNGKTYLDNSTKEFQKKKLMRNTSKVSTSSLKFIRDNRLQSKRKKTNNEEVININSINKNTKKDSIMLFNGLDNKEIAITPTKDSKHSVTSDSGITSSVSTSEKTNISVTRKIDSSDCERTIKNLEWFRKKVDVARRNYRKRIMLPVTSSSESSDN